MNRVFHPLPLHYVSRLCFNLVLRFFGGSLTVRGTQHIPKQSPFIVVLNHMSVADLPLLLIALPPLRMRFWIAEKWRTLPVLGFLSGRLGGIFLDRSKDVDRRAIRESVEHIKSGGVFGLAPEATRSHMGMLIRPKSGAAWLASQADCPIIPLGVIGTDKLFSNFLRGKRTKVEVRIGQPFTLPPVNGRVRSRELDAYTDYIMLNIARLLPSDQHGYYAMIEHPGLKAVLSGQDHWPACYPEK